MISLLPPQSSLPDVLASVALLAALLAAWGIVARMLRGRDNLSQQIARRWAANVRNALILVAVIGLLMIWAPQLRTFALSLTAVAVAIVVATKELILCLSGSTFRTFTRAYSVGDFIEIGEFRGEVVDISLLSTKLAETDRRDRSIRLSGHRAIIPHSLLFANPARIISREGARPRHGFSMVFDTRADVFAKLDAIRERARTSLHSALAEPPQDEETTLDLAISTTDLGRIRLEFEFDANPSEAGLAETAIAASVGSFVMSLGEEACATNPAGG